MWTLVKSAKLPWAILVLGGLALAVWLRFAEPKVIYQPGPTSTQYVYVPKWKKKVETVIVPVDARIEYLKDVSRYIKSPVPDNVTAVGEVPPHTGKTTVISSLANQEGVLRGALTYKQQPTPFLSLQRSIGLRAGYGTDGITGEVFVQPLRVGPATLEGRVYGHSDPGEVGAALLVEVRF